MNSDSNISDFKIILNESKNVIKYMNSNFKRFPFGFCSKTSFLLAHVLKKRYNIESIAIISGSLKNRPRQTHAWVFANGYIVDLTLNQFNEELNLENPEIFISNNSDLHSELFDYEGMLDIPYQDDKFVNLVRSYFSFYGYEMPVELLFVGNQDIGD